MFDAHEVIILLLALMGASGIGYLIYMYASGKLKIDIYDFIVLNVNIINEITEDIIKSRDIKPENYNSLDEYYDDLAKIVAVRFRLILEKNFHNKLLLSILTETVLVELIKLLFQKDTHLVQCLDCQDGKCKEHK